MNQIFIPSKGRAGQVKTLEALGWSSKNVALVVEPQEAELYKEKHPETEIIVLPENDQGIAYVRNYIHNLMDTHPFWMLDDDIIKFYIKEGNKMRPILEGWVALKNSESFADENTGQVALDYQQFAWSADKDYALNSYCDVAVWINPALTHGIKYRPEAALKEDRDFTMQVIKAGYDTKRIHLYGFAAPKNGSNKGGLKDLYDTEGREEAASRKMIELWGEHICQMNIKPDGRPDVKIHWNRIRSNQMTLL